MIARAARLGFGTILAILATGAAIARADTCPPLQIIASVRLAYDVSGRPFVPVTLGTAKKFMLVDTGGALSMIGQTVVDELQLPHRRAGVRQYGVSGTYSDQAAEVSPFAIGNLVADHMDLMIAPDKSDFSGEAAGIIGPAILRNYDAEFDFGGSKFNLISQDHCPGKVIYWPAAGIAAIPMRVAKIAGHIVVPVTLDGITLNALVDTGATNTFITSRTAESNFNLKLGSVDAPDVGPLMGSPGARIYRHTFHSLSLEGIAVGNPVVGIIPDLMRNAVSNGSPIGSRLSNNDEAVSLEDITLGIDVLKHLHLYIAYKEQMLYVTPAEPTDAQAPNPATAAAAGTRAPTAPH